MKCPKCHRQWDTGSQQAKCIDMFGECVVCRFVPPGEINPYGSGAGSEDDFNALGFGHMQNDTEPPGTAQVHAATSNQTWPHTFDAAVWADEWMKTIADNPDVPTDRDTMIGWFSNAIMTGYDYAMAYSMNKLQSTEFDSHVKDDSRRAEFDAEMRRDAFGDVR